MTQTGSLHHAEMVGDKRQASRALRQQSPDGMTSDTCALIGQGPQTANARRGNDPCRDDSHLCRFIVASYTIDKLNATGDAMSLPIEALEAEVLRLPRLERARLLDRVVASLDADQDRDEAWDRLAALRDAELDSGSATPVSGAEAIARLRTELL